jgi:hypothetical protein
MKVLATVHLGSRVQTPTVLAQAGKMKVLATVHLGSRVQTPTVLAQVHCLCIPYISLINS